MREMTLPSYIILHRALECPTCSEVFLASPPDDSHTRPSRRRPGTDKDTIRARHVCSQGHGSYVYWANPPIARTTKSTVYVWPYVIE